MIERKVRGLAGGHWQVIDMLCTETSSLIEQQGKIQVLAGVHYKLGKTLQDVENIMALPAEAAAAEEMLRDDNQLLQVPLHLSLLRKGRGNAQRLQLCPLWKSLVE